MCGIVCLHSASWENKWLGAAQKTVGGNTTVRMYVHDCTCMYHVIGYILYWDILGMIAVTHDPERNDGGKREDLPKIWSYIL